MNETGPPGTVVVRRTESEDHPAIIRIARTVYTLKGAWNERELASHLHVFPEGQLVATRPDGTVVGMAASLVLRLDRYPADADWWTLTGQGTFRTHDRSGETLYGAGVLVDPDAQGEGVGTELYRAREALLFRLGLQRIVAGARISGYRENAHRLSAEDYVASVLAGELDDPSLSFQLSQGFRVLRVVADYLPEDEESLGYAAIVEWRP